MVGTLNQGKEGIVDQPAEIYIDLRTRAFGVDPAAIGLAPTERLDRVYGVILDLGYPEGPATLVGFSDGTTSLYTSSGWGVIGGGEHEVVAEATLRWLTVAESMIDDFEKADDSQLPQVGDVAFTVLTYDGALPSRDTGVCTRGRHVAAHATLRGRARRHLGATADRAGARVTGSTGPRR